MTFIAAILLGLLTTLIVSLFDKTPNNKYAWAAGGVVALLVILAGLGFIDR